MQERKGGETVNVTTVNRQNPWIELIWLQCSLIYLKTMHINNSLLCSHCHRST